MSGAWLRAGSRIGALAGVLAVVGALPWLADRDPAYTVLRARYADREATPQALASVRAELGLDGGPLGSLATWLGGVVRGDLGTSWVSGRPVAPSVTGALGVSLELMLAALGVTVVVAALIAAPTLRGVVTGRGRRGSGLAAAALTAVPEFVLALILLLVVAVWLGWVPPYGWGTPALAVLPALALSLPGGGLLGRLLADAVADTAGEPWIATWRLAGTPRCTLALAVLRRAAPSVTGQAALVVVGLTAGAVAVEEVFAIPGLGRLLLGAAAAQDLPVLQGGLLLLLLLALGVGAAAGLAQRLLLGRAVRLGSLPRPVPTLTTRRRDLVVPGACLAVLALVVAVGLPRDPDAVVHGRLTAPSWSLPLGADATGRDVLARVAHGTVTTVGVALLVTAACVVVGLLLGCLGDLAAGPVETANALPPVLVGLLVVAVTGPSTLGAAVAVGLVAWAPLASHTAALLTEARAQPHVRQLPVLGVGRARALVVHLLPAIVPAVVRHAALRLPGVVLALTALGFLGLGPRPPAAEWGLVLADGTPYLERAPWVAGGPAIALVLLAVAAVAGAALSRPTRSVTGR